MKNKITAILMVLMIAISVSPMVSAVDVNGGTTTTLSGNVRVCEDVPPTVGISSDIAGVNFGTIHPGSSDVPGNAAATLTLTKNGVDCATQEPIPGYVDVFVSVIAGDWTPTTGLTTEIELTTEIIDDPDPTTAIPVGINPVVLEPISFELDASPSVLPGDYSQVITISGTY